MSQPPRMPLIEAPLEFRLRSGGAQSREALVTCPKCGAPAFIRRSDRISETYKVLSAHCTNTGCGATADWDLALKWMINPGLVARPDLNLPTCPREKITHVLPPSNRDADDGQTSMFETR